MKKSQYFKENHKFDILHKCEYDERQRIKEISLVVAFLISAMMISLFPSYAVLFKYIVLPVSLLMLFQYSTFDYLIFPISYLDDAIGPLFAGHIRLFLLYLILLLFKKVFVENSFHINRDKIIPFYVICMYFIFAASIYTINSVKMVIVFFCTISNAQQHEYNKNRLRAMCMVMWLSSFVSAFTIAFGLNAQSGYVETGRMEGIGFVDPNYSSMVCLIGLCILINYEIQMGIKKIFQIIGCLVFLLAIFRTGSRSGLISFFTVLLLKLIFEKGIYIKIKNIIIILIIGGIILFVISRRTIDIPDLDYMITRWSDTLVSYQSGDMTHTLSNRNVIASDYLNYYFSQNIFKILFGGNIIGSQSLKSVANGFVTHNLYLDLLLGFGFIGMCILLYYYIRTIFSYLRKYYLEGCKLSLSIAFTKIVVAIMGIALALVQVYQWWYIFWI